MRFHELELGFAEHVARLPRQHDVEGHDVGFPQQRLVIDRRDAVGKEVRGGHIGIISDDPCAPRGEQLGDACANAAEADEADGLTGKTIRGAAADVIGEIVGRAPFARAHISVALGDLLQQRQHEGDGGFGDAEAVRFGRRVAHHDAELGRGFRVHVVDADGIFRDDAQPLRSLHDAPADRRVTDRRAHQRHRVARRLHHGLLVRGARQLPRALAENELAAQTFERGDGLRRFLARGKDQDCGLGH